MTLARNWESICKFRQVLECGAAAPLSGSVAATPLIKTL